MSSAKVCLRDFVLTSLHKTEVREQKSEVRGQKAESKRQKAEGRRRRKMRETSFENLSTFEF
jgi:hypothetical protein